MPGDLALGEGAPEAFGIEGQWGLCMGAPQEWGKKDPILQRCTRLSSALGFRAKQRLYRISIRPDCSLEYLLGKEEVNMARCQGRAFEAKVSGIIISMCSCRGSHFGKIRPYPSGLRSPRPNINPRGNTALPISKKAA